MNPRNKWLVGGLTATLLAGASLWEGNKAVPYQDVIGVWTVCKGHTGPEVIPGRVYTPAECEVFLKRELKASSDAVLKCTNVPLTQYQHDAFTLFTYNVGASAFCNSKTVLAPLNRGEYTVACDGLLKWVYADGKYFKGLYNRRVYERKLCLGELNA